MQGDRDGPCASRGGGGGGEPAGPDPGRPGDGDERHELAFPGHVRTPDVGPGHPALGGTDAGTADGRPRNPPAPGGADAPPRRPPPPRGTELSAPHAAWGLAAV